MSTSNTNRNTKTPTNTNLYEGDIHKHTSTMSFKEHSPPQNLKSQPSLATLCQALQCASCILSLPISLQASAPAPLGLSEGWDTHTAMHFCFTLAGGSLRGVEGVIGGVGGSTISHHGTAGATRIVTQEEEDRCLYKVAPRLFLASTWKFQ